jgi:outer membrane cobalamin receptor
MFFYSGSPRRRGLALRSCALVAAMLLCGAPSGVSAAPTGSVVGIVTDLDGAPVTLATITLEGSGISRSARSDRSGAFTISGVGTGTYLLDVEARGYARLGGRTVDVSDGQSTWASIQLVRSTSSLTTIGHVTTRAGEALSTSSATSQNLDAQAYAARGGGSVADLITDEALLATVVRPAGGNPAAPAAVALRGPDPTETLLEIDGHEVNSGGSGAFDVSLLDAAQLTDVQLVYGISPSSLIGPNTIDGAINIRTLDPTTDEHGLLRLSLGSFSTFGETLQATGTDATTGYALSLHRQTTRGETDQAIATVDGATRDVGSGIAASTGLAKIRVGLQGGGYVLFAVRDQSAFRDLSAALSSMASPMAFNDFSGSAQSSHDAGYGADLQLPLGRRDATTPAQTSLVLRHLTAVDDESVIGPAAGTNPYLNDDRDLIDDEIAQLDHALPEGSISLKFDFRTEGLRTQVTSTGVADQARARRPLVGDQSVALAQTQRSAALRYTLDPTAKVHYAFGVFLSAFTTFGTSLDPRIGVTWTPTAQTSLRASIGTSFQSPQLPELYVPPVLPPPDANGFFDIGNPHLKADRATDFGVGFDHIFGGAARPRLGVDLYRTDLRDAAERFIPSLDCAPPSGPAPPPQSCESYPINIGSAVYQGIASRLSWLVGGSTRATATYSVNAAFPTSVAPQFQNGTIVVGEQFAGVPLDAASLSLEHARVDGLSFGAGVRYEGRYNELNRPPFATFQADVSWRRREFGVGMYATNLTNVYDDRFTLAQRGVPYGGVSGPIPSDAFSMQGRAVTLVVTTDY